jgi:Zn-dependent protease with chaperone function
MAKIDAYYPPTPKNVPEDLAEPTGEYKTRVFLVLLSLIFAFGLYVFLTLGALAATVLALVVNPCVGLIVAVPGLMFFLFLVKGFFKTGEKERTVRVEITADDQPLLFDFIELLCEETGAPPPRKVYVSHEVNAAVMTHTGMASLFWPTGKDLLIGLGLVNILSLSEFKSVLAHEFGHFAQKSTRLGGYVYTANRLIYDLVCGRDWFDEMIERLKRSRNMNGTPSAIAAVGWTIYGLIWVLRKVLEGAFFLINLLHRSLSRQMEFNADLVAVSVAGSDAGIQALYRLTFCDDVWGQAIKDLRAASDHKLYTADLFYHLNHAANFLRKQKKDPKLGEPPPLPEDVRDTPDLFTPEDDGTPQMWATHPSNYDREQNAKAYYIRSTLDNRSAWVLFKDPQHLREEITYRYYRFYKVIKKDAALDPPGEVQAFIDDEHAETTYDPRYHGLYDSRYVEINDLDDIVDEAKKAAWDEGRLERVHLKLYDNELKEWMDGHNNRSEEYRLLTGLVNGDLELKDDELEFRGRNYDVREAKRLLKKVDKELEEDRQYFEGIDRRAFLVYYQMALQADDAMRKEFFRRYDFHLTSQDMLRKLNAERNHMEATLQFLNGRRELQQHEFRAALKSCRDAQKALKKVLGTADDLPLPDLANMKKGKPLGHFLLDKKLVHSLDTDAGTLRGEWINKLMNQIGEVQEKLRRIHFKSLGGILLLQDRIHKSWRDYLASMPTVCAVTEEPAGGKPVAAAPATPAVAAPARGEDVIRRDREPTAANQAAQQVAAKLAAATTPAKPAAVPAPPKQ